MFASVHASAAGGSPQLQSLCHSRAESLLVPLGTERSPSFAAAESGETFALGADIRTFPFILLPCVATN